MYAYCNNCGYDSGDGESLYEVKDMLILGGGRMEITENGYDATCPHCLGELKVD